MTAENTVSEEYLNRLRKAQQRIDNAGKSQDESGQNPFANMTYATKIMAMADHLQQPMSEPQYSVLSELCAKHGLKMPVKPLNSDLYSVSEFVKDNNHCKMCDGKLADNPCYKTLLKERDGHYYSYSEKCTIPETWRIIRRSKMPPIYAGKLFESDFDTSKISQLTYECFSRVINSDKGAYFFGPPRTGKTFAACCIINHRAQKLKKSLFYTVSELMVELSNFQDQISRADVLYRVKNVPLLVIDDLGAEYSTEYSASIVFDIVDYRYSANLPIVVTSNFRPAELNQAIFGAYGERIARRLQEFCTFCNFKTTTKKTQP